MKKRENYISILKHYIPHIGAVSIIVILCLLHIKDLDFLAVLNDEFGYWGNAAGVLGYDWSDLLAESPYYAWGYSLWLVLIMKVVPSYYTAYKVAILLNVFFLIVSYGCSYWVGRKLFTDQNRWQIILCCIIVNIYPSNIVYAQVAWSESLLYMLMWVTAALIVSMDIKFTYVKMGIFLFLLGYMYVVHQRSIGIILVGLVALIWMLIVNKKPVWIWVIPIIVFFIWYFLNSYIKGIQLDSLWKNSLTSNMNNVGLDETTIIGYLRRFLFETKDFIKSMGGKFFYLIIATGAGVLIAINVIIIKLIDTLKNKKGDNWIIYFYIFGSLIAMWGVCSLQMIDPSGRQDILVYARYMENAIGPSLLLMLIWFNSKVKETRWGLIGGITLVCIGVSYVYETVLEAEGSFNIINSPVVGAFFQNSESIERTFVRIVISTMILMISLFIITFIKREVIKTSLLISVFFVFYIWIGNNANQYVMDWRVEIENNIVPIEKSIVLEHESAEIYYVKDVENDLYSVNPKYLQFMMRDREIHVIEKKDLPGVGKGVIVLTNANTNNVIKKEKVLLETDMLRMYVKD